MAFLVIALGLLWVANYELHGGARAALSAVVIAASAFVGAGVGRRFSR